MIDFSTKAGFNLIRRHRAEKRFQWAGRSAIFISLAFLVVMVGTILRDGSGTLRQTQIAVVVDLGPDMIDPDNIAAARFGKILKTALRAQFPDAKKRKEKKKLYNLVSPEGSLEIKRQVIANPDLLGGAQTLWLTASDDLDLFYRGKTDASLPEKQRRISDLEISWINTLARSGSLRRVL